MTGRRPTWSFVLVAAGAGRRMGGIPKQFRMLGGTPMWQWSARVAEGLFLNGKIDELVVVFPCGYGGAPEASDLAVPAKYVDGGRTRAESVKKGLESACFEYAMIHDAARPFLPEAICEALMGRALGEVGAIPLLESTDSLKLVDGGISALPRDKIYRTQTPQAFKRATMLDILKSHDAGATDEASLWLEAGYRLEYVPGSQKNFKVTTDFDWAMAKSLAEGCRVIRVGMGYDVHELVPGRKLILGGVEFESPLGLLGHSDADIICHAVSDSLLGAAGEGDIGSMFPASDERYRGASSMLLLKLVIERLNEKNWIVGNVDVTLVAQTPRLGDGMRKIADSLKKLFLANSQPAELSVRVKSGERVGSAGRAECMECYAASVVERYDV